MGYYLRAFCRSDDLPPLRQVFDWVAERGVRLELSSGSPQSDLESRAWREVEVSYKPGKQPLVVDVNRSADGDFLAEEIAEFVEFLEDVPDSPEKARVLDHLQWSRAVVGVQVLSDIDEDGSTAVTTLLDFFVENCGGMFQDDAEGFYEGERLIVKLFE